VKRPLGQFDLVLRRRPQVHPEEVRSWDEGAYAGTVKRSARPSTYAARLYRPGVEIETVRRNACKGTSSRRLKNYFGGAGSLGDEHRATPAFMIAHKFFLKIGQKIQIVTVKSWCDLNAKTF
jgi:hypothetical protein